MDDNNQQQIIQNLDVLFGQLATSKDEKLKTIFTLLNSDNHYKPANTPCSTCPNAKWFSEIAEVQHKEYPVDETSIKCNCSSLFSTTYHIHILENNSIAVKKFIPVCSGNPTFIPKV